MSYKNTICEIFIYLLTICFITNTAIFLTSSQLPITGLKPRKAAFEILKLVANGVYSDVALQKVLRRMDLSSLDKGLVTELAYGSIRQRYFLDCWIDFLGAVSALKQPPLLRWLLHIGIYQIFFMDRIPESAVVNTTVELAKTTSIARLSQVVNGILRAAARAKKDGVTLPLLKNKQDRIARNHSLPLWLVNDLISWEGEEKAEAIAKSFNENPPIDLRINCLNSSVKNIQKMLLDVGINSEVIKDCPYGLEVKDNAGDVRNWPGYKEGKWCVQDRAAQWISPLLNPKPYERILDACSAPGGKTTHIAELIGDKGKVWAVDRSEKRLRKVLTNAERLHLNSISILQADACNLLEHRPDWRNYFQKILIDAPCSGLGTLARNPDARWRIIPSVISDLVSLQECLLDRLLPLLAKGGRIVYSTCTINPRENSKQIDSFLKKHPQLKLKNQRQILPNFDGSGDGFYSASIDLI